MARKRPLTSSGTLVVREHTSKVLAGNPLGDPHVRNLGVWLPPEYDRGARARRGRRYPVLYDLVGFTGSGLAHVNWKPFGENVIERAARLIHERKMGPVILVFPDCFTCLGGNQYINSTAVGRLRRLSHARDHSFRRPRIPHARLARAPRLLRQVLRRLRRDHPRDEISAALGRRSPITRATPTSTSSTGTTGRTR